LELKANLTRPDMSFSTDSIDFATTYVTNIKSSLIRIENIKEVNCKWQFIPKTSVDARVKDHLRFNVVPACGSLTPGQKALIKVNFIPTYDKLIKEKINFKIKDNPSPIVISLRG